MITFMQRQGLVSLMLLVVAASLIIFAISGVPSVNRQLGATTNYDRFGSNGIGSIGWQVPPNTLVSTSHISNKPITGFIEATLNVFPYQIQGGTVLYLSLYLDGQLAAATKYDLSSSHGTPASVIGTAEKWVAKFSNSMLGFTVSQVPLNTTFPAGTKVTLLSWVNSPIWVQIDSNSPTHSYETLGFASYSALSSVKPEAGIIAPYTLSVGFESNAV
jgi:hypothetical protein